MDVALLGTASEYLMRTPFIPQSRPCVVASTLCSHSDARSPLELLLLQTAEALPYRVTDRKEP